MDVEAKKGNAAGGAEGKPGGGEPPPEPPSRWQVVAGCALIAVVIGLLVWQNVATQGQFRGRGDQILLLIGVALVTGVAFWLITRSQGELNLPQLGIRLVGGAGIGAGFMYLAWKLTSPADTHVIVQLRSHTPLTRVSDYDAATIKDVTILRHRQEAPSDRALVEFQEGKERGRFTTLHLVGSKQVPTVYEVTTSGLVDSPGTKGGQSP
jgi:hypothetical protein